MRRCCFFATRWGGVDASSLPCAPAGGPTRGNAATQTIAAAVAAHIKRPYLVIMLSWMDRWSKSSVAIVSCDRQLRSSIARRAGGGPLAGTGQPLEHRFQAGQRVSPLDGHALPRGDANGDVAAVGQRRQQAHDIALDGDAGPGGGRAGRERYGPAVLEIIGDDIVLGAQRERGAGDHQVRAAATALDRELQGGAVRTAGRRRGGDG